MAVTRTPRERWISVGLTALAAGGPDAVSVEALGRTLGVSKGGFYWQFSDRHALLEAMLDVWEQSVIDDVISLVESVGGDARERLRRLFALASSGNLPRLTQTEGPGLTQTELAIRDWARREDWVAARLQRVDNRRMNYMRTLFGDFCPDAEDVERRCLTVMALFIGSPFIAADHGPRTRAEVVQAALRHLEQ